MKSCLIAGVLTLAASSALANATTDQKDVHVVTADKKNVVAAKDKSSHDAHAHQSGHKSEHSDHSKHKDHGKHDEHAKEHNHSDHGTAHGHGDVPSHAAPAAFDQTSLKGDVARIDGLLRATFETSENNLSLAPLIVVGNHAMVGWVQDGRGGRAMLTRNDHGIWALNLCGGDGIKGKAAYEALGLSPKDAAEMSAQQEREEAKLSSHNLHLMDSFGDTIHFD